MVTTFDAAIRAPSKWKYHVVRIAGRTVECTDITTSHKTDRMAGGLTAVIEAPLPEHIVEGAEVDVVAGYLGITARIFHGYITDIDSSLGNDGQWATITASGWGGLLADNPEEKLRWNGPISLKEIVRSVFAYAKVPSSFIDNLTYDSGATIRMGLNKDINDGRVELTTQREMDDFITQVVSLFGYAAFDTPLGELRVKRISGQPVGTPVIDVEEGQLGYEYGRLRTTNGMATYWRVTGARYTDEDGVEQTIASVPLTVPLTPAIPKKGWKGASKNNAIIETQAMADAVRNIQERDYGAPLTPVRWTTDLAPHVQPGDVARVTSPTVGASGLIWITEVNHSIPHQGMNTTTFRGIRGNGATLPAGNDCIAITLRTAPVHLGDEHVAWYAEPNASGREVSYRFYVQDTYTSLKVVALGHGCNSYLIGNDNADASVSRYVLEQNGEEIGSGDLPVLAEDYDRQLPYGTSDQYWGRIVVPLPGSIEAGTVTLKIVSGEDSRLPASTKWDDFEIKNVVFHACNAGLPEFVGGL